MRIGRRVEHDLNRHALYHLDVIAGGILRRQQVESGAAPGFEAVDVTTKDVVRIGVDADLDRLADAYMIELRLLESWP
jgi:hypothetical protein